MSVFDKREIRGAVTGFSLVAAFLLVAVSVYLGIPGQALLQTLRFHIAAVLALGVVVLLATGGWKRALIFGAVLSVSVAEGGYFIYRMFEARSAATEAPRQPLLTLLSFNILNSNFDNSDQIADFIAGSDADVVIIMEAVPLFDHREALAAIYPYRAGCTEENSCDLMLLSRTPLSNVEAHSLSTYWQNRLFTAVTEIDGRRINIAAAHMVKPYFDSASVWEAHVLNRILDGLDGPLVLAGDFNAAPWSDNIAWLIQEAGLVVGPSFPASWPVELGPVGVPIDNVFTRAPLVIDELHALDDSMGSNHRGLVARIGLSE